MRPDGDLQVQHVPVGEPPASLHPSLPPSKHICVPTCAAARMLAQSRWATGRLLTLRRLSQLPPLGLHKTYTTLCRNCTLCACSRVDFVNEVRSGLKLLAITSANVVWQILVQVLQGAFGYRGSHY